MKGRTNKLHSYATISTVFFSTQCAVIYYAVLSRNKAQIYIIVNCVDPACQSLQRHTRRDSLMVKRRKPECEQFLVSIRYIGTSTRQGERQNEVSAATYNRHKAIHIFVCEHNSPIKLLLAQYIIDCFNCLNTAHGKTHPPMRGRCKRTEEWCCTDYRLGWAEKWFC